MEKTIFIAVALLLGLSTQAQESFVVCKRNFPALDSATYNKAVLYADTVKNIQPFAKFSNGSNKVMIVREQIQYYILCEELAADSNYREDLMWEALKNWEITLTDSTVWHDYASTYSTYRYLKNARRGTVPKKRVVKQIGTITVITYE